MSQNRNSHDFSLSYDQRLLLQLYIDFYNHTTRQADSLRELQNEIRGNINQIVGLNTIHQPRNTSQNSNVPRNNFRQNNHSQSHNARNAPEQRRHRNHFDSMYTRYMYHGNIPYLVPLDNITARMEGRTRNTRENANDDNFFTNLLRTFYDRVNVAPTRQQIEAATRILIFSEIENPLNNSCPVTLDRFESNSSVTQIIPCGHIFSPFGIDSWLQSNVRCPVCRYDIRDYNENIQTANASSEPIIEEAPEEETKEDNTVEDNTAEESKNDSEPTTQERNSIPNNNSNNSRRAIYTRNDIQNTLSSLTENILGQILNPNPNLNPNQRIQNFILDTSFNSLVYDSSNNQFIFEGFLRR